MPLSPPSADREELHTRRVTCRGYRRADGLWDIEGHLCDTKSYAFDSRFRGRVEPGGPVHDMWLRITVDNRLTIVAAEAATDAGPFAICPAITDAYKKLAGLRIGPGFRKSAQEIVGRTQGCTHHTELLWSVATTAFQTLVPVLIQENPERWRDQSARPPLIDSCHAYASDGELVRLEWPRWYTGKQ